jgi:UDP-N-acetylmuramyl tripeptide synthase
MEEMYFDKMLDYWIISFATVRWENIKESIEWLSFDVKYLGKYRHFESSLRWMFNVYNILAATSVGILLWISLDKISNSVKDFRWLPWRLQLINKNWKIWFVDFAHTPKALESVLKYLNNIKSSNWKLITIFWAPWERDPFKRPQMWKIASQYSDVVVLTDDDPAGENRYDIASQVARWVTKKLWEDFFIILDRGEAIKFANEISQPWDIILVAGKWHETVQLTNFWPRKWSDVEFINNL